MNNDPFKIGEPSVFVVATPFQCICAIAAINQLCIDEYRMIVILQKGEPRNKQVENLLAAYDINYEPIVDVSAIKEQLYKFRAFRRIKSHYNRLFVGDYRDPVLHYIGCNYLPDSSDVVYLDDGNATINILKDSKTSPFGSSDTFLLRMLSKYKHLDFNKNLLTIYSDLNNRTFNIKNLDLSFAIRMRPDNKIDVKNIYFVGTNISRYPLKKSDADFCNKLDHVLSEIKSEYPDEHRVYIPHGRDMSDYAEPICKKHGFEFRRTKMMIEMELINEVNQPKAIYGFTSSALFNLKKIFPQTRVVNILFESEKDNPSYHSYCDTSNYYEENGIELIVE